MSNPAPRRTALGMALMTAVFAIGCSQESGALAFTGEPGRDNAPRAISQMPADMPGVIATRAEADPFRAAKLAAPHAPHAESF